MGPQVRQANPNEAKVLSAGRNRRDTLFRAGYPTIYHILTLNTPHGKNIGPHWPIGTSSSSGEAASGLVAYWSRSRNERICASATFFLETW